MNIGTILVVIFEMQNVGAHRTRRDTIGQNRLLNNVEFFRAGRRQGPSSATLDSVVQIARWMEANRSKDEVRQFKTILHKRNHGEKFNTRRKRLRYRKFVQSF